MFNRTLHTLSANLDRLNLGTRSLVVMTGANNHGQALDVRSYPHARTSFARFGIPDDQPDRSISKDPWSASRISSSPAVSVSPPTAVGEPVRVVVVAEPSGGARRDLPAIGMFCPAASGLSAGLVTMRKHALKSAKASALRAAPSVRDFGLRDRSETRRPRTTATTLTRPDTTLVSGG